MTDSRLDKVRCGICGVIDSLADGARIEGLCYRHASLMDGARRCRVAPPARHHSAVILASSFDSMASARAAYAVIAARIAVGIRQHDKGAVRLHRASTGAGPSRQSNTAQVAAHRAALALAYADRQAVAESADSARRRARSAEIRALAGTAQTRRMARRNGPRPADRIAFAGARSSAVYVWRHLPTASGARYLPADSPALVGQRGR